MDTMPGMPPSQSDSRCPLRPMDVDRFAEPGAVKPPLVDRSRKKTYASLLSSLAASGYRKNLRMSKCGTSKRKNC